MRPSAPDARITLSDFRALPEYTLSLPTLPEPGFRWRRFVGRGACPSGWWIGEAGATTGPALAVRWQRVVFFDPDLPIPAGLGLRRYGALVEAWCDTVPGGVLGRCRSGSFWPVLGQLIALDQQARR